MQLDAATALVLAAGVSGLSSAITAIGVVAWTKRSDERRHIRELVMRTAVENWKAVYQAAKDAGSSEMLPLDVYILHMLKLSEIILAEKKLKPDRIARRLSEVDEIVEVAIKNAEDVTARARQRRAQHQD